MLLDGLSVALDLEEKRAEDLLTQLQGIVPGVKVGLTLYGEGGNAFVKKALSHGFKVFLDLKYHDIPHQVRGAVKRACDLGVSLCTVHTPGGPAMLEAAAEAAQGYDTKIVGVTVLTSLGQDDLTQLCVRGRLEMVVEERARMAAETGIDGVVCSPLELRVLRDNFPRPFSLVTPGIRAESTGHGDQKRVLSAGDALRRGSDLLVVGRPITQAERPDEAAAGIMSIIQEVKNG